MKTPHLCLLVAAGGLLFGPRQLLAQDKPADPKPPAEAAKPAPPPDDKDQKPRHEGDHREGEHGRRHHEGDRHGPELKPTPFIGVMTRSLSPEVRAQTGLQEGFGLLVEEVLPDSPAKTAGIQQHDVLVLLGDQRLVNMEQLAVLVHSSAKDSDIVFTIKRAGVEQKVTVKVGEKMLPAMPPPGFRWPGPHPYGDMFEGGEQMQRFGQDLREKAERFQRGMREFQGRMQDWSRGPRDHAAPQEPRYDHERGQGEHRGGHDPQSPNPRPEKEGAQPPPQGGPAPKPQSSAAASATANGTGSVAVSTSTSFERNVTRRDRSGEYSLRQEAAGKIFTVKPADGEEQTFSVTTEEQRKAVPEAFRGKLQELEEVSGQVKAQAADEAAPAEVEVRTTTI